MKLSIVIPVFNEEKTVSELMRRVISAKIPVGWEKEIIVVDDGSTDNSLSDIRSTKDEIRKREAEIKILRNKKNLGKGAAVRRGIAQATGDVLVIQDADLEYNPNDYKILLKPIILNKSKVVYGSRLKTLKFRLWGKEKTPLPLHYLANRFLSYLTNLLYGAKLTDIETCYKMMNREVYSRLNLVSNSFEIEPEITAKILKMGYKIFEVPITTIPRSYKEGKKIKATDALKAIWALLKFRF